MLSKKTIEIVTRLYNNALARGHEQAMKNVHLTAIKEGNITAEFRVIKDNLNERNTLHSGLIATIIDSLNAATVATSNPDLRTGVTVTLNINYMKDAKEGDDVLVDSQTSTVGDKITTLKCILTHKSDGSLIARGTQTQFVGK